jgi:hypothetical protein
MVIAVQPKSADRRDQRPAGRQRCGIQFVQVTDPLHGLDGRRVGSDAPGKLLKGLASSDFDHRKPIRNGRGRGPGGSLCAGLRQGAQPQCDQRGQTGQRNGHSGADRPAGAWRAGPPMASCGGRRRGPRNTAAPVLQRCDGGPIRPGPLPPRADHGTAPGIGSWGPCRAPVQRIPVVEDCHLWDSFLRAFALVFECTRSHVRYSNI